jgi:conjugative relaxase-like TrwC/TraI family protein
MLSVYTLKSASQASQYYTQGDYYITGDSVENNVWFGKGAEALGLVGAVDVKQFKLLLEGKLPNGMVMHNGYDKNGNPQHRPGYDLTFSACKSASILAIVGGDDRITKAHIDAVKSVLTKIENDMAGTRIKIKGDIQINKTNNIVTAMFNHTDSRLLDPNLHTHCILLNMTQYGDKWRTLYGDDFYNLKMAMGLEYRMHFAQNLMKLGYEIEQTTKNGLFEIASVPKDLINHFSKRRVEIEKIIDGTGRDASDKISITVNKGTAFEKIVNTTVSSMATLYSRAKKQTLHKDELQQHWTQQLQLAGANRSELDTLIEQSKTIGHIKPDNPVQSLSDALPLAIEHLTSNRHIFTEKELIYAIKGLSIKANVGDRQIASKIEDLKSSGSILITASGSLTTKNAQNLELENQSLIEKGKDSTHALLPVIANFLTKYMVKDESKIDALNVILSSKDKFIGIESSSEKQAHDLLKTFCKFTPHCTHYVLSKNHNIAKNVASDIGVNKSFSTQDFINYTNRLVSDKGNLAQNLSSVWIINRSEQLTHQQINSLLKNSNILGAKVLFTGDNFRVAGIQQYNPFKQLSEASLPTIALKSNTNTTAILIKEAQIQEAIASMQSTQQITYLEEPQKRLEAACAHVASRESSTLLVQNKSMAMKANALIREYRVDNGAIKGETLQAQTLIPISMSTQEKIVIVSYNVGDIIRFNSSVQNTEFKQGGYYTITNVNEKNNTINLSGNNNIDTSINFSSSIGNKISVYRPQMLSIQSGDCLRWNDNTPKKINFSGYINGDPLVVVGINGSNIQVLGKNGIQHLDLNNHLSKHIDYNYAKTISNINSQQNINGAILIEQNCYPQITSQDVYSALKSFKSEPQIFASNAETLLHDLQNHNHKIESAAMASTANIVLSEAQDNQQSKAVNYNANKAIDHAVAKLAEREAAFRAQDLEYLAYSYDIKTPISDLKSAISTLEGNGTLVPVEGNSYVFKEIYDCEKQCLDILERGVGKLPSIIDIKHQELQPVSANTMLTAGQKEAIITCLTSNDRITLIQGVAGSGKTTMLKEVKTIARNSGHELVGLANTASAKINLHLKSIGAEYNPDNQQTFIHAGMQSQTLASFILASSKFLDTNQTLANAAYPPNTILVLDEASMVSARNMHSLLNVAEKLNLRLIVIGDDRQLPAIEASRVFSLMLGTSNNVVNMNINTRLKTPESLEIMQLIYASNLNPKLLDKAFDALSQNIVEIPDKQERLQVMANYYTSTTDIKRSEVLPMMPENKDRVIFNGLVRDNFKKDGVLTGAEITTNVMVAKDLTTAEKMHTLSFDIGDFVRFNSNIDRLGIKTGSYYQVVESKNEQLILNNDAGDKTSWNPYRHSKTNVEVYRQESRGVMSGDSIRWRRNFEDRGIVNSEIAKVLTVNDSKLCVELANGKTLTVDTRDRFNQHFDHAYGSTVHVAQGLDRTNPIGLLDGPRPYKIEIDAVSKGSMVVIPGNAQDKTMSKVGQVIETNADKGNPQLKVIDREGNSQILNDKYIEVYPDFDKTKHQPLSNICNFLVQATRGDDFIIFVDNVEGYKASLKHSLSHLKKTALEMIDVQKGNDIKSKVAQMTSQVFGIAKPSELNARLLSLGTESKTAPNLNKELNLNFENTRKQSHKEQFHLQLDSLKQVLNRDPLRFATQILGLPVTKNATYANFAMGRDQSKGNLTLDINGAKAGLWCDHRTGGGGDLVSLYANQYSLSYIDAAKKLFNERNIKDVQQSITTEARLETKKLQQRNDDLARAKSIKQATQLYNSALTINGTLAEKYLNNIRGIKVGIPTDFKFSPLCWHKDLRSQKPALLIPAYDEHGKLQSVNRVYLNPDANKLNVMLKSKSGEPMQATQKAVIGPSKAATVFIDKTKNSHTTYLTEGVENALSIKQSVINENISACFGIGQLKNITLSPETKTVVICADNDGNNLATKKALQQTVAQLLNNGLEVKLALPLSRDPSAKYDYNQMLTDKGVGAITTSISQSVDIKNISDLGCDKTPLYESFAKLRDKQLGKNIESTTKEQDTERML